MIEDFKFEIHDKFELEVKLNYSIENKEKSQLDLYYFFPKSLNLNYLTYPKHLFYRNIKNYIRFNTKKLSIFDKIEYLKELERIEKIENPILIEIEMKKFICYIEFFMVDYFKISNNSEINIELCAKNLEEIIVKCREKILKNKKIKKLEILDQYLSYIVQQNFMRELKYNKKLKEASKIKILDFIEKEKNYFEINYGKYGKEHHYKYRLLKKYIHSFLFLDIQKKIDGKIMQQVAYGIASLITMIFITLFSINYINTSMLTLKFLLLTSVAYAFKDRMKDLFKAIFYRGLSKNSNDYLNLIFLKKQKIMTIKESYNILSDRKIERKIRKLRNRVRSLKNLEEDVIKYTRKVKINRSSKSSPTITERIYFDVRYFLTRMDDPEEVYFRKENNEIIEEICRKEYHINLIAKIKNSSKEDYHYYEIILDRDGINRIKNKMLNNSKNNIN